MDLRIEEMTLGQKLKRVRESLKKADKRWTMDYVAQQVGVSKGAISQYENGENKPSHSILLSLAKLYNVTPSHLIDPIQMVTEGDIEQALVGETIEKIHKEKNYTSGKARLYLSELPEKDAELYIPYYDVEITAGQIELYFDDIDERPAGYIYAPQYRDCVACNVKGDSMYDKIFPGSRLYVYHLPNTKYIDFGQIYLVVLDGYRLLKYIQPHPNDETKVILDSYNKHYKPWPVDRKDIINLFLVKGYENQNAI